MPADRIDVIYCGVGDEFFLDLPLAEIRAVLTDCYGLNFPYILYVGALEHPNKNLVRLLQAYDYARTRLNLKHKLLLVGPKRWKSDVIFDEIKRLHLDTEVAWLGYVPKTDLQYLYSAADLFVYVSLWEGFGLPVLEAMASGVPVIASNTSSLPEVVGDAGILVNPLTVSAIAEAMHHVLSDRDTQARLRQLGPQRARSFSWANSAAKLLQVFEAVYSEHRPG